MTASPTNKQQVVDVRHESGHHGRHRRPQVDGPVHVAEGSWAVESAGTRSVTAAFTAGRYRSVKNPRTAVSTADQHQVLRKAESQRKRRRAQQAHQQHGSAPQPICQLTANQLCRKGASAKERHDQSGPADGHAALRGQVQAQEWDHEAAQAVDDGPHPQEPEFLRAARP